MSAEKNPSPQNATNLLYSIGIVFIILCVVAVCVFAGIFYLLPSSPDTVEEYMEEYGGNPDVYNRILISTDCVSLQREFDQADLNLKLQEPGTQQYEWGLGYMAAADQRMKDIGCYE